MNNNALKYSQEWINDLNKERFYKDKLKDFLLSTVKQAIQYRQYIKKYNVVVDDRVIETLGFIINKLEENPEALALLVKVSATHSFFEEYGYGRDQQNPQEQRDQRNRQVREDYLRLKYLLYYEVLSNSLKQLKIV